MFFKNSTEAAWHSDFLSYFSAMTESLVMSKSGIRVCSSDLLGVGFSGEGLFVSYIENARHAL